MKSSYKRLAMLIMIISVLVINFGCTPKVEPVEPIVQDELTMNYGNFSGFDKEENTIVMGFVPEGKSHILKIENKELLDGLVQDETYLVAYNKDNVVRSIKVDPLLKEMISAYTDEIPVDNKETTEIIGMDKVKVENLTLLDESMFDFDLDGKEDKISMYTAAEKDSNGEVMWDDGQKWMIIAHSAEEDYVLFDDYVQLGTITFYVYTIDDDFYVDTIQVGTANITHKTYAYNTENKTFEMTVQYATSGNVNMLHSSSY